TDRPPLEIHAPVSRAERVVYTEQRPVWIEDMRAERTGSRDLQPLAERLGALSAFFTPVIYGGQILAAIGLVESDAQRRWSHDEQLLLARIAETIAPLILNAQLHSRLRSYIEDLLTLLRLASEVSSEASMDRTLRAVLDSWSKIAGTDAAAILRWDEEAQEFHLSASKHLPTGIMERYRQGITLRDPVCGLAAERRVGVVADLASETRFAEIYAAVRWSGLRAAWATPIVGPANRLLGVLVTFSRVAVEVSADEQRLADLFTRPIAVAMQNLEQSGAEHSHALHVKELEENLHQSERHKSEFMSIISHELRTPLNAVIGYAQMLKDGFSGELNEQQRADVQTIIDSADRLLSMVEDTLDLARIDADRFPIYMDSIAFDDIIRRAVAGVRSIAEGKGLEIKTKISQDAPVIRTDSERVRQVLMSLLSNAVKFTDTGMIQITVERVEKDGVQVNVTDTGIGFDTIAFPHLFEEFRQGDASNTRLHGGTGLGLAISKRLVQRLGGHIGVTSTPGEGSTFWFRLPLEIPGADS
ncbi:MAG: ATP-binding protein, partial [Pyrinomonadaceae bacterium]